MGVHIFTKIKNRQFEKEKKYFFSYFSSGIPDFSRWGFSKNVQCFVGVFL